MKSDYDVIVVGGGPAGSATALGLAQRGYQIAVLDRARFPRDKACGEFLTPQACHLLDNLGVWDDVGWKEGDGVDGGLPHRELLDGLAAFEQLAPLERGERPVDELARLGNARRFGWRAEHDG